MAIRSTVVALASAFAARKLAMGAVAAGKEKNTAVRHTDYGAEMRVRGAVTPGRDGIYGILLPSGAVLSCYSWHSLATYSLPSGVLEQNSARSLWGPLLPPGTYKTITTDTVLPQCALSNGAGKNRPQVELQYATRIVGMTGVRAAS